MSLSPLVECVPNFSEGRDPEIIAAITDAIAAAEATNLKDMGRVMAALKERYAGRMDFAKASATVKAQLG